MLVSRESLASGSQRAISSIFSNLCDYFGSLLSAGTRSQPLSHVLLVTRVNLYGYGILAFDRKVAGLSPTDGVWSL